MLVHHVAELQRDLVVVAGDRCSAEQDVLLGHRLGSGHRHAENDNKAGQPFSSNHTHTSINELL